MADVFSKAKRSEVMARIRSRGNRDTELALARLFRVHGISGWRRQRVISIRCGEGSRFVSKAKHRRCAVKKAKGGGRMRQGLRVRPDFVFPKLKVAVFVDGCFWHGCPKHATWPSSRAGWWRRKIEGNKARDALVTRMLRRAGWRVVRVWEHELERGNVGRLMRRMGKVLGMW